VLIGALYFGVSATLGIDRIRSLWLMSACVFVVAQLLAETYRGLVAYPYPVHDVRLLVIAVCSTGFGLSVMGYTLASLAVVRQTLLLIAVGAITFGVMTLVRGFDFKTLAGLLVPLIASLIVALLQARTGRRDGWILAAGFLVFISLLVAFATIFIDVVFYLVVSAFLLFLFAQQGFSLARERALAREAAVRADRLQLALDQALEAQSDSQLSVTTAGKVERIGTAHIVACRSDAGYSELLLDDGRSILHSATLAELEVTLPGNFLRVHRSYLINTRLVKSLARDPAGTGTLTMKDGRQIPVSRRTMPAVRLALK
jgi:DNA-binding LytR/AlgR family response regulator